MRHRVRQEVGVDVVLLRRFFQDALPGEEVAAAVQQDALGLQPVAAGPARFLLIMLDRFRHAGMQHEADVRAVDAHAERHRGDDQVAFFRPERFLRRPCGLRASCPA